jgi:hypothetical protein
MKRIGLVGCCAAKLDRPAPARDLYRSPLFRKASAYAEATCDEWAILSAEHHLVSPRLTVWPYDSELKGEGRLAWARIVADQIVHHDHGDWHPDRTVFVVLAGANYARAVAGFPHVEQPLAGLQIGERLAWLNRELEALGVAA